MESCLSYIYPHTRIHSVIGILKTTAHNAFPVVTVDKAIPTTPEDRDYPGNPISSNEEYARSKTMSFVFSEQRVRSRTVQGSHVGEGEGQAGSSARLLSRQQLHGTLKDVSMTSASAPSNSFMNYARPKHNFNYEGLEEETSSPMDIGDFPL
jgi:hypothetical protein